MKMILWTTSEYFVSLKEEGVAWKAAIDCTGKPVASSDGNGAQSGSRTIGGELADAVAQADLYIAAFGFSIEVSMSMPMSMPMNRTKEMANAATNVLNTSRS